MQTGTAEADYADDVEEESLRENTEFGPAWRYEDFPLLSPEEEKKLLQKKCSGDNGAREILIQSNIGLVVSIAVKYLDEKVVLDDLVQSGVIGLITAIDRYDISIGSKLSTYAVPFIRAEIARYKKYAILPMRIPYSIDYRYRQAKKMLNAEGLSESEDNIEKLSELMNMDKWYVLNIISANKGTLEFKKYMVDERNEDVCSDIGKHYSYDPFLLLQSNETSEELLRYMKYLTLRQRVVVMLRYGFIDGVEHTFEEIGKELNFNRRRAYQIVTEAQETLTELIRKKETE